MESQEVKEVLVVKHLSVWGRSSRPTVSIEEATYSSLFSFLSPRTKVVSNGKVVFVIVDREYAIETVKAHYRIFNGSS